jgi:hypothetical protein
MAVLSIDIARLEVNLSPAHRHVKSTYAKGLQLEELLRKDTSLAPSIPSIRKESQSSKQPRSPWQKLMAGTQSLLRGRAATNISLLMVIFFLKF